MMQLNQKTKLATLISIVLAFFLLCGVVFTWTFTGKPAVDREPGGTLGPTGANGLDPLDEKMGQAVIYERVEMRRYEGEDGHPYIHDVQTNHTPWDVIGYQRGMLAFDRDGAPLEIDWQSLDTQLEHTYFYLYESDSVRIPAGGTDDVFGGWSLNIMGEDTAVPDIAYVLYCDKEITFADGIRWENPDFENWRNTYERNKMDVTSLETYYPYEHRIDFS